MYTLEERRLDIYRAVRKVADYRCTIILGTPVEQLEFMLRGLGISDYDYAVWDDPCSFVVKLKNGTIVGMSLAGVFQMRLANTTYVEAPRLELPRFSAVVREERVPVYVNVTQTVTHTATQVITQTVAQPITYTETAVVTTTVRETAVERVTETAVRREVDWGAVAALSAVSALAVAAAVWLARRR